ncbi:Peptidase C39 family protein [compost metagenome]
MIRMTHSTTPLPHPPPDQRTEPDLPLASEAKTEPSKPPEPDVSSTIWKGMEALLAMSVAKKPKGLNVVLQGQGLSNACGTTSLAMLLSYWGIQTNHDAIDAVIRRTNMPTAPDDLVRYAENLGLRASLKTDAGLEDLAAMLDQGVPVQVLIDPMDPSGHPPGNPNDAILHYVNVTGYQRGPDGRISRLTICDPGNVGRRYSMTAAEFEKVWSNLKLMGLDTGINRLMIAVAPADDRVIVGLDGKSRKACDLYLPKAEGRAAFSPAMPARVTMQGLANVMNGWAGFDLGSMLGGSIQFLVGGMASLPGAGIRALVKGLWGSDAVADMAGKAVSTVMAPFAAMGEAVGGAVQAVGNAVSDGLKAVGNFLKFW